MIGPSLPTKGLRFRLGAALLLGSFAAPLLAFEEDDTPLSLADLPEYQAALRPDLDPEPAIPVGFRDVWDDPDAYRERRVQVEGRVVRRFRQGPVGEYPPLAEVWILTRTKDPFCLVFPDLENDAPDLGAEIRFEGTFLRRVRYEGGDSPRLAPLVVGPEGPSVLSEAPTSTRWVGRGSFSGTDWALGGIAAALVVWFLVRQVASRPVSRQRFDFDPPPPFLEPGEAPYNNNVEGTTENPFVPPSPDPDDGSNPA